MVRRHHSLVGCAAEQSGPPDYLERYSLVFGSLFSVQVGSNHPDRVIGVRYGHLVHAITRPAKLIKFEPPKSSGSGRAAVVCAGRHWTERNWKSSSARTVVAIG